MSCNFELNHLGALYEALGLDVDATGEDLTNAIHDMGRVHEAMRVHNALTETLTANSWDFQLRRRRDAPMEHRWEAAISYGRKTVGIGSGMTPVAAIVRLLERVPRPQDTSVSREQMQLAAAEHEPPSEWTTVHVFPRDGRITRQGYEGAHPAARVMVKHFGNLGNSFVLLNRQTGLAISDPWSCDNEELPGVLRQRLFVDAAKGENIMAVVPGSLADRIVDPEPASGKRTGKPVCPDGGVCHHECPVDPRTLGTVSPPDGRPCFRVLCASPLGGVFTEDRWPPATVEYHREAEDARKLAETKLHLRAGAEVHRQHEEGKP